MGRGRRVYFEDEIQGAEIHARRTRGQSRRRSLSAERVHSLFDDVGDMQGRDRVISREAYDKLWRENQYFRIELRERQDNRARVAELERENAELQRHAAELQQENRDLRRTTDYASDSEARKDSKLSHLRKKYAKLEAEVSDLKAKLADVKADSKKKISHWRTLYEELSSLYTSAQGAERREEDAQRRVEILRKNMDIVEAEKARLELKNDELRAELDKERLRRRHY